MAGRTTDLTPSVQQRIVDALRKGNYAAVAARLGGIHKDTYYTWLKRGQAGEQPFADFADAVEDAIAEAQANALAVIQKAATGYLLKTEESGTTVDGPFSKEKITEGFDWRAAGWFMERRHPDEWGNRHRVEHSGAVSLTRTEWERE